MDFVLSQPCNSLAPFYGDSTPAECPEQSLTAASTQRRASPQAAANSAAARALGRQRLEVRQERYRQRTTPGAAHALEEREIREPQTAPAV